VAQSVFHFAGHAVSNSEQPELSFLALGGDTRLIASDLARLDLRHLDVAVLSACSTQGAVERRGGLASGVAFGFLLAGARATVSTLWDVADDSAIALQMAIHERIARGVPAAAALRAAQLEFIGSSDVRRRNPKQWAGLMVSER
jgi:CHAT domain-containing protein